MTVIQIQEDLSILHCKIIMPILKHTVEDTDLWTLGCLCSEMAFSLHKQSSVHESVSSTVCFCHIVQGVHLFWRVRLFGTLE